MQTRRQVKAKIHELTKELMPQIEIRVERLLCSGAVDLAAFSDDFRLAKVIYYEVLLEIAEGYRPWQPELQDLAENLKHF